MAICNNKYKPEKRFLNSKESFECFECLLYARILHIPISGPIIKAKAKEIADK